MKFSVIMWKADNAGCGHCRIDLPTKYLNKLYSEEFESKSSSVMNPSEWITLIDEEKKLYKKNIHLTIHQRQYGSPNLQNFRYLQDKLKIPCIYEIDDFLHGVHPLSSAYHAYNPKTNKERFDNINSYLKEANAVTVTTEYLKGLYSVYNKNIYVLPNYLDFEEIFTDDIRNERKEHQKKHKSKNEIWIGWAGSNTHLPDLKIASDAVIQIMKEFPNVKLCLGGWDGLFRDKEGTIYHPELNPWKDIPDNRKVVIPWAKNMQDYPKMLSHFDIGLAPLEDNDFNRAKCLVAGTKLVTETGIKNIEDIKEKEKVWQESSFEEVNANIKYENREVIKLKTKKGYEIEGTTNHKLRSKGEFIELQNLKIGNKLDLGFFKFPDVNYQQVSAPFFLTKKLDSIDFSKLDDNVLPKVVINEDWGFFLGCLLGDGCLASASGSVSIACHEDFTDYIQWLFDFGKRIGIRVKSFKPKEYEGKGFSVNYYSRTLKWFFAYKLNIRPRYKKNLRVPEIIWKSPKSVISKFIQGLFETDGSVYGTSVSFTTKDEEFAKEIQFLLLGFGIISNFRKEYNSKYHKYYFHVCLGRQGSDIFEKEIGFFSKIKKDKLRILSNKDHSNRYEEWELEDEIVEVTYDNKDVFDIEIPKNHYYLANGIISHNSDIKIKEYGACGVPCIASDVEPYSRCINSGVDGFLVKSKGSTYFHWYKKIKTLVENETLRNEMSENILKKAISEFDIAKNIYKWRDIYLEVIKRG